MTYKDIFEVRLRLEVVKNNRMSDVPLEQGWLTFLHQRATFFFHSIFHEVLGVPKNSFTLHILLARS